MDVRRNSCGGRVLNCWNGTGNIETAINKDGTAKSFNVLIKFNYNFINVIFTADLDTHSLLKTKTINKYW